MAVRRARLPPATPEALARLSITVGWPSARQFGGDLPQGDVGNRPAESRSPA
jgi:hypothetical protein